MKLIGLFVILALVASAAFLIFVRLVPDRAEKAHVDPFETGATTPASAVMRPPEAPVFQAPPDAVFDAAKAYLVGTLEAVEIGNGPAPLHATFVIRSTVFRFPDDLSLKVLPTETGTQIAVYSRSRLAGFDHGVNRARVNGLIDHLIARFPPDP